MEESRSSLEILIAKAVQSIDLMLVFMFFLISQLHFSFACWSKFDVSSPALLDFVLWPWRWPISDGSWSADGSFVIFTAHSLISMHDGMQWSFYSAVKQKHPCLSPLVSFDLEVQRLFGSAVFSDHYLPLQQIHDPSAACTCSQTIFWKPVCPAP